MRHWRAGCALLATVVVALVALSCDRGPQEAPEPPPDRMEEVGGGTLRFAIDRLPTSLDPVAGPIDTATLQVLRALYDPLLVIDENSALRPNLAQEVRALDDEFTSFEITVRPGVTFSDGAPVDAAAVASSLRAALDEPSLAVLLAPVTEVRVVGEGDDAAVVVELREPWASFPYQLAGPVGMVVARPDGGDASGGPVGSGPFVLSAQEPSGLVVERRDGYWREGQPLLERVEFPVVADASVRAAMLRARELDVATFVEPEAMAGVSRDPDGLVISTDPSDETSEWVLVLNTRREPFAELLAREAVAFAVDRDAIATRVFAGEYRPAKGPYSEGSRFFGDARWPILDIGHANDLATQHASRTGEPLAFQLLVPPGDRATDLGRLLVAQLATVGIAADLVIATSVDELDEAMATGAFDAAVAVLFDGGHPDEDLHLLTSSLYAGDEARNPSGYESESLAEAIAAARASDDVTPQAEAYQRVQAELAVQLPYLFLVYGQGLLVSLPEVQGLTTWSTPDGHPGVDQMRLTVSLAEVWLESPDVAATPGGGSTPGSGSTPASR